MRVIDVRQGTEEWERLRARPTASESGEFCTPAKGQYSKSATAYAAKIVTKRMGMYTEPVPTQAMEWGTEHEADARAAYQIHTGTRVQEVGFILPDGTDAYGGSPDGLVGDEGLLEIKCPFTAEKVVYYHAKGTLPLEYKPQVQMLLLISGRPWLDFWAWFPGVKPFLLRVGADKEYQTRQAECLLMLLETIDSIEKKMGLNKPQF